MDICFFTISILRSKSIVDVKDLSSGFGYKYLRHIPLSFRVMFAAGDGYNVRADCENGTRQRFSPSSPPRHRDQRYLCAWSSPQHQPHCQMCSGTMETKGARVPHLYVRSVYNSFRTVVNFVFLFYLQKCQLLLAIMLGLFKSVSEMK